MTSVVLRLSDLTGWDDDDQRLAVPTEDIICDALQGRFNDLWRLVDCPLARMRVKRAWEYTQADVESAKDAYTGARLDDLRIELEEEHRDEIAIWEERCKALEALLAKATAKP